MEQVSSSSDCDQSQEKNKLRRIRKVEQLEDVRKNALATKRKRQPKPKGDSRKPKTSFTKTLNQFAAKKKEVDDARQCESLLLKQDTRQSQRLFLKQPNEKDDKEKISKPIQISGFFRGGIKGKLVTRISNDQQKLKNAILNNDALQLMQSGNYSKQEPQKKLTNKDIDLDVQMEAAKIFKTTSERSSSVNGLLSSEKEDKFSSINGLENLQTNNLKQVVGHQEPSKIRYQLNQPPNLKQLKKEDQYLRRQKYNKDLFENDSLYEKNKKTEHLNYKHDAENSTPENALFFARYVPPKNKTYESNLNCDRVIRTYGSLIRNYEYVSANVSKVEIGYILEKLRNKDPVKHVAAALKATLISSHKKFLQKQVTASNNSYDSAGNLVDSEIMLEPNSEIRRKTLKKNTNIQMNKTNLIPFVNSGSSKKFDDLQSFAVLDSLDSGSNKKENLTPHSGRKSWKDERRIPLSTKANADPGSAREKVRLKIESVDKNRQELVARYLNDMNANRMQIEENNVLVENGAIAGDENYHSKEEKLQTYTSVFGNRMIYKSTKYIPAILKKSQSLAECVEKEKILLTMHKNSGGKNNQLLDLDSRTGVGNLENERTPSSGNVTAVNQILKAAKSKHMQFKYNRPPRIDDLSKPTMSDNKFPKNTVPKMHLFEAPKTKFIQVHNVRRLSPVDPRKNFMDYRQDSFQYYSSQETVEHNSQNQYHKSQLSQGNPAQENVGMGRMPVYGDIQERTDRLTLCSTQNQRCSQEGHHGSSYHDQYDSSIYNGHLYPQHDQVPTPQLFNIPIRPSSCNCRSHKLRHLPSSSSRSDFGNGYAVREVNDMPCQSNGCRMHVTQVDAQAQGNSNNHPPMPMQRPNAQQAVKFIAVGENDMPQRRPIYGIPENNYVHKVSNANQPPYTLMTKPLYSENVSNQSQYVPLIPTHRFCEQGAPTRAYLVNADFEYHNRGHDVNDSNSAVLIQTQPSFDNQVVRLSRNNFHPNGGPSQILVGNRNVLMHPVVSNQQHMEPKVIVEEPYAQPYGQFVNRQPVGYYSNVEAHLQQVHHHGPR